MKTRPWEVWHNATLAREVHGYWQDSPDEMRYRRVLAGIVKDQMLRTTDSILEVGCGTGLVYDALLNLIGPNIRYVGVDNSKQMLGICEKVYHEGQFEQGDAFALPYADNSFGIACAFEVFGHMPDCSKPIAELIRVARHTAIFTLWITAGDKQLEGGDHYEYHVPLVNEMLTKATLPYGYGRWEFRDLGASRVYVVRKG